MLLLVIKLVSETTGLRFKSGFRHHNILDSKDQNNFSNVEQFFIRLVSHIRHLRFMSMFKNHNYSGLKGHNSVHKSQSSMFDKFVDVGILQLVITLVSHTRGLRFECEFKHLNYSCFKGQNCLQKSINSMIDEYILILGQCNWLARQSDTVQLSGLSPASDIIIVLIEKVKTIFTND